MNVARIKEKKEKKGKERKANKRKNRRNSMLNLSTASKKIGGGRKDGKRRRKERERKEQAKKKTITVLAEIAYKRRSGDHWRRSLSHSVVFPKERERAIYVNDIFPCKEEKNEERNKKCVNV